MFFPDQAASSLTVRQHAIIQCAAAMFAASAMRPSSGHAGEASAREQRVQMLNAVERYVDDLLEAMPS